MRLRWDRIKKPLLVVVCLAVIAGAGLWTYRTQFATPEFNVELHRAVGRVMAEQTTRLLDNKGKIVVITMETAKVPELRPQIEEFEKALAELGHIKIKQTYTLETENQPKYGLGSGLSGRRYVRIVNKNLDAAAIVSFVGAPRLTEEDLAQLKTKPKLIAESRSAEKLKPLFDSEILHVGVVARFQFPTPIKGKPRTPQDWFNQRFQIVTATNASSLPAASSE
jgi:hypothetical protein